MLRAHVIAGTGSFRLARRSCELHSVKITVPGACGRVRVTDGHGRDLFYMPSSFPGSFMIEGGCEDGLIVHARPASGSGIDAPSASLVIAVNWREPDREIV